MPLSDIFANLVGNSNNENSQIPQNFNSLIPENTSILPAQSLIPQNHTNDTNTGNNLLNSQTEIFIQNNTPIQSQEFLRGLESIKAVIPEANSDNNDNS